MSKVYAVQRQYKASRDKSELVPKFDLSPATVFGELVYLLGPNAAPWNMDNVLNDLHAGLREFTAEDYLLLIGNPVLIGCTVAVAAEYSGGVVQMLQWSGRGRRYVSIKAHIFDLCEV